MSKSDWVRVYHEKKSDGMTMRVGVHHESKSD